MMKNIRRNVKALSPIFATLILIAIAVIAGIVVYMFTSGSIGRLGGGDQPGSEKVAIQAISGNATAVTISLYGQSMGGGPVGLDSAIVKDYQGNVVEVVAESAMDDNDGDATDIPMLEADLTRLDITVGATTLAAGESYTVTLVSTGGNSFVSQSFKAID